MESADAGIGCRLHHRRHPDVRHDAGDDVSQTAVHAADRRKARAHLAGQGEGGIIPGNICKEAASASSANGTLTYEAIHQLADRLGQTTASASAAIR
jgi:hypothetical protein